MAVKLNSSSGGSVTLQEPTTASNYVATLPTRTGNVSMDGPAFSVSKNANQSISGSTWTKISFQTEEFDTNNNFDNTTNYRFTPTVAGYYQVSGCAWMGGQPQQRVTVWKNGTYYRTGHVTANGGGYNNSSFVSCLVYLNGSTDYIELYAYQAGGAQTIDQSLQDTYFQGVMVRSA